jgi:2-desacetyl-2-hydroxyethyl bacteriochlorophyllide A dehydrogenase
MKARAVSVIDVNKVEVVEYDTFDLEPGEVLVEVDFSFISPGTELRCLAGLQPNSAPWGFVPGYSQAGTVVEGSSDWVGKRVVALGSQRMPLPRMWGGHTSHSVVQSSALFEIPDGVEMSVAGVSKMGAIAHRGLLLGRPYKSQTVAVVGLGLIGQLSARLFHQAGADVIAFDQEASRVRLAREVGVNAHVVKEDLIELSKSLQPEGFEIVVDATGSPRVASGLHQMFSTLPWGDAATTDRKLIVQGSYPAEFPIPYQEYFSYETTIVIPRDSRPSDLRTILNMMASGDLSVDNLVAERLPADQAQTAYDQLIAKADGYVTAALDWH